MAAPVGGIWRSSSAFVGGGGGTGARAGRARPSWGASDPWRRPWLVVRGVASAGGAGVGRWATSLAMWMAGRWWASAAATVLRWMLVAMVMFVLDPDLLRSVSDPALGGFGHRSWVLALQTRWLEGFRGNLLAGVAATPMAVPLGVAFLVGGFGEELLSSTPPRSSGENLRPPCSKQRRHQGGVLLPEGVARGLLKRRWKWWRFGVDTCILVSFILEVAAT